MIEEEHEEGAASPLHEDEPIVHRREEGKEERKGWEGKERKKEDMKKVRRKRERRNEMTDVN